MNHLKVLLLGLVLSMTACNNNQQQQTEVAENPIEKKDTIQQSPTEPLSGKVSLEKLPSQVNEFIAKNYNGYNISGAAYDPLCTGGDAIDVAISKKGQANYSLIFLLDGTFIQQEVDLNVSNAPSLVLKSVKEKFADFKIASQIEKLTLADKSIQYLLDISKGNRSKEVILKEDGTIVCESKE